MPRFKKMNSPFQPRLQKRSQLVGGVLIRGGWCQRPPCGSQGKTLVCDLDCTSQKPKLFDVPKYFDV